jgi:hypothetical protein
LWRFVEADRVKHDRRERPRHGGRSGTIKRREGGCAALNCVPGEPC